MDGRFFLPSFKIFKSATGEKKCWERLVVLCSRVDTRTDRAIPPLPPTRLLILGAKLKRLQHKPKKAFSSGGLLTLGADFAHKK